MTSTTGKKHTLILITNHFPFGKAEAFLESELDYLIKGFDKVIIVARDVTAQGLRMADRDFLYYRVNPVSDIKETFLTPWLYLKHFSTVAGFIRQEVRYLRERQHGWSLAVVKTMIHDLTKAMITAHH